MSRVSSLEADAILNRTYGASPNLPLVESPIQIRNLEQNIQMGRQASARLKRQRYFVPNSPDAIVSGMPPYRVIYAQPSRDGWSIEYVSSEAPLIREGFLPWVITDAVDLGHMTGDLEFAFYGQRVGMTDFNNLETVSDYMFNPTWNWETFIKTAGAIASAVAPALSLIPGYGQILSPLVGGLGNVAQGKSYTYTKPKYSSYRSSGYKRY